MKGKIVKSVKMVFKNGNDYEAGCETGLDKGEVVDWVGRVFMLEQPKSEPLIKDEKIRKAVRAWAEANGVFEVQFGYDDGGNWSLSDTTHEEWICIEFKSDLPLSLNGCRRTVKELCGEEDE